MNNIRIEMEGLYDLIVRSPRGDRAYVAHNLILNAGIDRMMGSALGCAQYCQIGTGQTAPAATDTQLQNRIASTNTIQVAWSNTYNAGPPDYIEAMRTYRFALGALNSSVSGNFAEVGVGWAATGSLFSRALITDVNGNATTISVLADEQLDVVYRFRLYPLQSDVTGSITLDGVSYNYVLRAHKVNANTSPYGWWAPAMFLDGYFPFDGNGNPQSTAAPYAFAYTGGIATRTADISGKSIACTPTVVSTWAAYTNGTFQRDKQYTWDLNDFNINIKTLEIPLSGYGFYVAPASHQIEFTPTIPKDSTKRLRLTFTYSFANRP